MRAAGARPLATGGWTAVSTHRSCCPRGGETVGLPPILIAEHNSDMQQQQPTLRLHQHRKMCCRPHGRHQRGGWREDVDVQCCGSGAAAVCAGICSVPLPQESMPPQELHATQPTSCVAHPGALPPQVHPQHHRCLSACHSEARVSATVTCVCPHRPQAQLSIHATHQIVPFPSPLLFPVARGLFEGVYTHGTLSHMSGVAAWLSAVGCVW